VDNFAASHAALRGLWRQMAPAELAGLLHRRPPAREKKQYLAAFDESHYRRSHDDVALAIAAGDLPDGRHHYDMCGFDEGRLAFDIDNAAYCREHPIAAVEIAQGDYWDPAHHFLSVGRARGY
jgi:hypothetical protein